LNRRKEGNWLLGAIIEDSEIVRGQSGDKFSVLIEDAGVQLYEFGCGSQLRCLLGIWLLGSRERPPKETQDNDHYE
jgi:hypothetical protein